MPRALILDYRGRLLVVNAHPQARSGLWYVPGSGVESGASLPGNLSREEHEECGLTISVGDPALVNKFHAPDTGFHLVDIYFRGTTEDEMSSDWTDPEGVVAPAASSPEANWPGCATSLDEAAWCEGVFYVPLEVS